MHEFRRRRAAIPARRTIYFWELNTSNNGEAKGVFKSTALEDEAALKGLVEPYLKPLFGFSLSYAPYSREQAFQITVSSFARTLRESIASGRQGISPEALFRHALEECERTPPTGTPALTPFAASIPVARQASLKIVREALIRLPRQDKAVLLLRDQCHLPFDRIAAVLGIGASQAESACLAAREHLRASVKDVLEQALGDGHAV